MEVRMAGDVQLVTIQVDSETRDDLRTLGEADYRSMASELRWLVSEELKRRSQPNPLISVADAMLAHQTTDRDDPTQK
jgi:hypothetical protein